MADLLALSSDLPTRTLAAGEVLLAEGDAPGPIYLLVAGTLTVERDGVAFARIDAPGSVFGEMSVTLGAPVTATVRAGSDVVVRVADDGAAFLLDRPAAAFEVLRTTAGRLDGMTRYLVDVKAQFAELDGHLGLVDQILDTLVHHQAPRARTGSARDPESDHVH